MKSGKKLVLNRETVRALSVQEMQNVAGGFSMTSSSSVMTLTFPVSQHCGNGGGKGDRTGGGQGNAGTKYCAA